MVESQTGVRQFPFRMLRFATAILWEGTESRSLHGGTDNPDLSKNEIKNINVYDNVLNWIGTWPDNPYYGKEAFDNTETDDYSPVKQVRILNNKILATPDLGPIQATDLVTDTNLHSSEQFQNGDFERGDALHPEWISGLSNWTVQEKRRECFCSERGEWILRYDFRKSHCGAGTLSEKEGGHRFSVDVKVSEGTARIFVCDILTGEILADKYVTDREFNTVSLTYFGDEPQSVSGN